MADPRETKERIFWPSAEFGSLPADGGGIEVGHRGELREIAKKEVERLVKSGMKQEDAEKQGALKYAARLEELKAEYKAMENPLRAAARFNIEEVIRPEETRQRAAEWVLLQYEKGGVLDVRVAERSTGRLKVQF